MRNHKSSTGFTPALKNKVLYTVGYAARVTALMFASGTLMQTYLAALGFATQWIHIHTTLLQAANVTTILLCSGWASSGSVIRRTAMTALPTGLLFLLYLPTCLIRQASFPLYLLLLLIGAAQQALVGLITVCEYTLPYAIFYAEEYGRIVSICGIISSLLSLGMGALISALTVYLPFSTVMPLLFGISALLMSFVYFTTRAQADLRGNHTQNPSKQPPELRAAGLLKDPLFVRLIPANLLRGFAAGIISVLATVALARGFSETLTASMLSVQSAACLAACAMFSLLVRHASPRIFLLAGSLAVGLLPCLLTGRDWIFLGVYGAILFGRTLIDYATPAMLICIVDEQIAGPYHAWRMALQNAGMLAASALAACLPIPWLLAIGALSQLISGMSYYIVGKQADRPAPMKKEEA